GEPTDRHALALVAADDVARARGGAADGVVVGTGVDLHAVGGVAQRAVPRPVGAEQVARDHVERCGTADAHLGVEQRGGDAAARLVIAGPGPGGRGGAADAVVAGAGGDDHAAEAVPQGGGARPVGADQVARDRVAVRAVQVDQHAVGAVARDD